MGFLSGLFSDKQKTESTTSQNAQSQYGLTPEVLNYWKSIAGRFGQDWSNIDPNRYQTGAAESQSGLVQGLSPALFQAMRLGATGIDPNSIARFQNPYQEQVIDNAVRNLEDVHARENAGINANAAKLGALSGTQPLVARNLAASRQGDQKEQMITNLRNQGFDRASALAGQSAQTQLAGLGQAGSLTGTMGNINQGQFGMGTGLFGQSWQNAMMPYQLAQMGAQTLGGLSPYSGQTSSGTSTGTQTSTATPSPWSIALNTIGTLGNIASRFMMPTASDERVKENIEEIGETYDGQPIYRFNYIGDPRTTIGLMAQDVEQLHPEAVGEVRGIKTVDYDTATKDAVKPEMADGGGVGLPPMQGNTAPHTRLAEAFDTIHGLITRSRGGAVARADGGPIGSWETTVTPAGRGNVDWGAIGKDASSLAKKTQSQMTSPDLLSKQQASLSQMMQSMMRPPAFADGGGIEWGEAGPLFDDRPEPTLPARIGIASDPVVRSDLAPPLEARGLPPMEAGASGYVRPRDYWGVDERTEASLPLGLRRSNNLFNIKYFRGAESDQGRWPGLIGPSEDRDQGDPQMKFRTVEDSGVAAANLARRKYDSGMRTAGDIIAGSKGWTPGRADSAAAVAKTLGVGVNDDLRLDTPEGMTRFLEALAIQEHGGWARDNLFKNKPDLFRNIVARHPTGAQSDATAAGPPSNAIHPSGNVVDSTPTNTASPSFLERLGLKMPSRQDVEDISLALMSVSGPRFKGPMNDYAANLMEQRRQRLEQRRVDQQAEQFAKQLEQARELALGRVSGQPILAARQYDEGAEGRAADVRYKQALTKAAEAKENDPIKELIRGMLQQSVPATGNNAPPAGSGQPRVIPQSDTPGDRPSPTNAVIGPAETPASRFADPNIVRTQVTGPDGGVIGDGPVEGSAKVDPNAEIDVPLLGKMPMSKARQLGGVMLADPRYAPLGRAILDTVERSEKTATKDAKQGNVSQAVATEVGKKEINAQEGLARLGEIERLYKPEYQTWESTIKNKGIAFLDSLGVARDKLSDQQKQELADFTTFKATAVQNLNDYIREITGAAMSAGEADRIRAAVADAEKDSPTQFKAKLDQAARMTKLALARYAYTRKTGRPFSDLSLDQMNRFIDERARQYRGDALKSDPKATPDKINAEVSRKLKQEFGI